VVAQSVWRWATSWTIGILGFDSRRGLGIFLFTTAFNTALEPTQPPIQWVPVPLSLGVKRSGREADHSPPSGAEIKECVELYLCSPNTPSWRGAQLKHGENFTFYLYRPICFCCHTWHLAVIFMRCVLITDKKQRRTNSFIYDDNPV
jgi:hypothetical protein